MWLPITCTIIFRIKANLVNFPTSNLFIWYSSSPVFFFFWGGGAKLLSPKICPWKLGEKNKQTKQNKNKKPITFYNNFHSIEEASIHALSLIHQKCVKSHPWGLFWQICGNLFLYMTLIWGCSSDAVVLESLPPPHGSFREKLLIFIKYLDSTYPTYVTKNNYFFATNLLISWC